MSTEGTPVNDQPQPTTQAGQPKISGFLKVSIILLAALSIASLSLLFIGDFEGKVERIFSTFMAFAIFVLFTALDTRREARRDWYAPVALIANAYILALLLIVIWMTPASWMLSLVIFWNGLIVIAVTRAVVAIAQLLLGFSAGKPAPLRVFALTTSLLATLSGIFFTAPVAIEVFGFQILDLYWRIAVATLLLTALSLSITLLLRWAYLAPDREAKRQARAGAQPYQQPTVAPAALSATSAAATAPSITAVEQAPAVAAAPSATEPAATAPAINAVEQQLLPWPTFPDGSPLPIGPDGQPDFSALHR